MDIQASFNSQILQTMKTLVENNLNLTVGQQLLTSVAAINATGITLKWGAQTLTVENQNPRATFTPHLGQNVTLQVVKISPELEFKLVTFDTQFHESLPSAEKMNAMRLTIATAPLMNRIDESLKSFVSHAQGQQPVEAKVVGLVGNKIQLELIVDDHQSGASGKKMLISVEPKQLQLLPLQSGVPLKIGQALTLAITKIGATPEFTQLPTTAATPTQLHEEKITALMKQLLPRHESPAVLLNQLQTELPKLEIKNDSLATTLKQNATAIFEHLQPNEQLFNPQKLKHLIYSSGLFFEAKNAATSILKTPAPQQPIVEKTPIPLADLKMPLLNLLQHTNITNTVKQLISMLLQNLLKQESAPTPEIAQLIAQIEKELHTQLLPLLSSETIPLSLKNLAAEILPSLNVYDLEKPLVHAEKSPVLVEKTSVPLADLKTPLLNNLLQHTSVTNTVKKLVSTLLQNLLKQESAPTSELAQLINQTEKELHTQLLPLLRSETTPSSLKNLAIEILPSLSVYDDEAPLNLPNNTPVDVQKNTDFKNDLFKLMHTLKDGIAQKTELALTEKQVDGLQQLQTKTESALAKVVIDQLQSLPKEEGGKQIWAFELPFLMGNQVETLKMEIQRDKAAQNIDSEKQHWSVNLTLTPPNLGEVQAVISYQNGVVNTYFKNQQPQTTALITENLENLKQQFQQAGLVAGVMSAHNHFQPMKSAYSEDVKSFLNERV